MKPSGAGGWQALADRPFALELTGPSWPLALGQEASRRLAFAARRRLPAVCHPALLPGLSGPATLEGALAQSTAEILAGLVVRQLAGPGSPVLTYRWRAQLAQEGQGSGIRAFPGKARARDEELAALRKENKNLREERDILRKAVAIFSRPQR